jgi:polysaccharide pyruvyl transferase CsaB
MKILLAGYYGFENVGDELLLRAVLDGVRKRLPEARPIVLSNLPRETSAAHQVEAISRWNPFRIAGSVWGANRLMFGGGGIFQDRTSKRSLLYYTGLVTLARVMGTPVVLCAVGVDSLRRFGSRWALRMALGKHSVAIGVRDSASAAALEEAGIFQGIGLFSDLVFSIDVPPVAPNGKAALVVRHAAGKNKNAMFGWIARSLEDHGFDIDAMSFQPGRDAQAGVQGGGPPAPVREIHRRAHARGGRERRRVGALSRARARRAGGSAVPRHRGPVVENPVSLPATRHAVRSMGRHRAPAGRRRRPALPRLAAGRPAGRRPSAPRRGSARRRARRHLTGGLRCILLRTHGNH